MIKQLWHRIRTGHWALYEYLGYDKYQFDEYGDKCLVCGVGENG